MVNQVPLIPFEGTLARTSIWTTQQAANAFGKKVERFWETVDAIPYVDELSQITGKPRNELVQAKRGNGGGTKLAVFYARWLDVKFAVFCDILNKQELGNDTSSFGHMYRAR